MLIVLAIVAVAAYYVWKGVTGSDEAPSCKSALNACIANCRRTTSEAPAAQACQDGCTRDAAACERR